MCDVSMIYKQKFDEFGNYLYQESYLQPKAFI